MQRSSTLVKALGTFRTCRTTCRSLVIRSIVTKCPKSILNTRYTKLPLSGRFRVLGSVYNDQFRHYSSFPEHYRVTLPALSPTMEVGTIIRWTKDEGDLLSEGDLLAEIETDKATMGFETPEEGYLAKILIAGGTKDVKIGTLVCIIVPEEGSVSAFKEYVASDEPPPATPADTPSSASTDSKSYPSHTPCKMPSLSPTMERGNLLEWSKSIGDELVEGDVLARIETDKSTLEWETPEEGFLAQILIPADSKQIPVGQIICVIVPNKEDIEAFSDYQPPSDKPKEAAPTAPPTPAPTPSPMRSTPAPSPLPMKSASPPPVRSSGERVFATPLARATAAEKGIDISLVQGTGPEGQVRVNDVRSYVPSAAPSQPSVAAPTSAPPPLPPAPGAFTDIPVTGMRKVIAERLLLSKQTIPHYYLSVDISMDNVIKLRSELNNMLNKDEIKLSVNDFIIKASALSLKKIPEANSSWQETFIRQRHSSDISIAVATDKGLITPIVFNAERKGLATINQDVSSLAQRARDNQLQPHEFQGGTFTISNLGMFGIKNFAAVINPPQSCILAVGGAEKRFVPDEDAEKGYRTASVMSVTLSCDHRVVDGAVGAQWLAEFKRFLEKPHTMLL